ncbi:hypothetical protein GPECTOR_959g224 [Gonium pectorale]|uniref:Uncharacterized protein n=1 Tax=Gonium pectorale TaxID=33097 RepID=A0A150FV10_GONPE|nr:hypothetical protein GPECTOR_959g224 [Gonium pectorale]|eukprot:KXZ41025.1 hypothetical protein GPECTOR_959g224 [Gonium pectorale]
MAAAGGAGEGFWREDAVAAAARSGGHGGAAAVTYGGTGVAAATAHGAPQAIQVPGAWFEDIVRSVSPPRRGLEPEVGAAAAAAAASPRQPSPPARAPPTSADLELNAPAAAEVAAADKAVAVMVAEAGEEVVGTLDAPIAGSHTGGSPGGGGGKRSRSAGLPAPPPRAAVMAALASREPARLARAASTVAASAAAAASAAPPPPNTSPSAVDATQETVTPEAEPPRRRGRRKAAAEADAVLPAAPPSEVVCTSAAQASAPAAAAGPGGAGEGTEPTSCAAAATADTVAPEEVAAANAPPTPAATKRRSRKPSAAAAATNSESDSPSPTVPAAAATATAAAGPAAPPAVVGPNHWPALGAPFDTDPHAAELWGRLLTRSQRSALAAAAARGHLTTPLQALLYVPRALTLHQAGLEGWQLGAMAAARDQLRAVHGSWRAVRDAMKELGAVSLAAGPGGEEQVVPLALPVVLRAEFSQRQFKVSRLSPRGWVMTASIRPAAGELRGGLTRGGGDGDEGRAEGEEALPTPEIQVRGGAVREAAPGVRE